MFQITCIGAAAGLIPALAFFFLLPRRNTLTFGLVAGIGLGVGLLTGFFIGLLYFMFFLVFTFILGFVALMLVYHHCGEARWVYSVCFALLQQAISIVIPLTMYMFLSSYELMISAIVLCACCIPLLAGAIYVVIRDIKKPSLPNKIKMENMNYYR